MTKKLEVGDVAKIVSNGNGEEAIHHNYPIGTLVLVECVLSGGDLYWCHGISGSKFPQLVAVNQLELVEDKEVQ